MVQRTWAKMDKLKKQFKNAREQFAAKKSLFEKKIERWKKKKNQSRYKEAKLLLEEALVCEQEIESVFDAPDWKQNRAFLKVKLNAMEGLLKELDALTRSAWGRLVEATIVVCVIIFILRTFIFGIYHVPTSAGEPSMLVGDRVWGNKFVYLIADPKPGDMVMFRDPEFNFEDRNIHSWWQKYVGIEVPLVGLSSGPRNMVKRLVAGPGDVIEGRIEEGSPVVYRNGKKLNEPYVNTYPLLAIRKETGIFEREKIGPLNIPGFLRKKSTVVLYSYDPKKDFEEQPFYYIDYKNVLYDRQSGYMKQYKSGQPVRNNNGKEIDLFGPYIIPVGKYWVMGDNRQNSIDSRKWGFLDRKDVLGKAGFVVWSLDSEEPVWFIELLKRPIGFFSRLRWDRFFKKVK